MIKFENVSKSYGKKLVLKNINIEIPEGKFVVLIGPSGCGKTTTLKMINRLINPNEGKVFINGKNIDDMDEVKMRRNIGYVIQQIGLFPNMTVAENICVVPKLLKYDKARCNEIVHTMLEMVNMPYDEYAGKYPFEMSGGQQQRIGVLRALAASPSIVLMDEPFGALDPMTREVLQEEVKALQLKLGKTIVFVTHDMDEALKMADTIIFMDKGDIIQMATPEEMLESPANDMVRSFLGKRLSTDTSNVPSKVDAFMRTNVARVTAQSGVLECAEKMARKRIDTLLVVDNEGKYLGVVSIEDIRHWGKNINSIESLVTNKSHTARVGDDAKSSIDYLLDSGDNYIVVLNEDDSVAGIVTKSSVARSVADTLLGDDR